MKSKFYDKIILSIEDSIEKQKQIRKELRIKNTGITEPLESEKFFSNYWPTTILENVVSVRGRIGYHGLTRIDYRDTGPILLSVGNISNDGKLTFKNTTHIHDKAFKRSPNIIVEKNDILLSKSGTIGKVCLTEEIKEKLTINAAINIFRCGNLLLPKYLFYWFKSPATQALLDKLAPGIAQRNLFQRELRRLSIPIPTLEFQNTLIIKIDELFSKIDSTKQSLEQTKLQLKLYRQSLFKSLFNRTTNFVTLEECAKIGSGGTPSRQKPEYYGGDIPWVKTTEVQNSYIQSTSEKITDLGLKNSSAKIYPKNSVIVAMYGEGKTRGKCAILNINASTNQACAVITCDNKKLLFKFCFYWFQSQYDQMRLKSSGGNQPNLNLGIIKKTKIPLPALEEQEQIVSQIEQGFSLIENTSQIVESTLQNLQTMKMSVLKQAFEGKLVPQDPNDEPASVLLERIKLKN